MSRCSRRLVAAVVLLLVGLAGCSSSSDSDAASPSATATATPTVEPTAAIPTSTPTATVIATPDPPTSTPPTRPTRAPDPLRTVWLIGVASGEALTLHEDESFAAARFDLSGTRIELTTGDGPLAFAVDGTSLSPEPGPLCTPDGDDAVIDGVTFEEMRCEQLSPDGRWMLFRVPLPDANGDWDQWVLDLDSGERRLLQAGLRHCGGCDGRFGPTFSPDGDRVYFSELIQDGRIYASDLETGVTELIAEGGTEIGRRPIWSRNDGRLLYSDDGVRVLLRDFTFDEPVVVPGLTWPARFDASGTAIYSPSYASEGTGLTTVVDATSFALLAEVSGAAGPGSLWFTRPAVGISPDGPVVAVEQVADCPTGTMIYAPSVPGGRCFESAVGATVAPDGRHVAIAVNTGDAASHRFANEYLLVLVDTATVEPVATIEGALSYDAPPRIEWNSAGTHLLVTWPHALGL